jgi:CDP-glucose 4,6-dehydratase
MDIGSLAGRYRGRRILVTGHTGFKGAWLCILLERLGAEVWGMALDPRPGDLYAAAGLGGGPGDIRGDIRDPASVQQAVLSARPDCIVHLAAQALVGQGRKRPLTTFQTNIIGTANILQAAYSAGTQAVLVATSDKAYLPSGRPCSEGDPLGGLEPYSASKAAAEMVAMSYRHMDGGPCVATARAGNVIGGGDRTHGRIVPDTVRALEAGERLMLRDPGAVRPWQHVLEVLWGYLVLASRLMDGEGAGAWNFGPSEGCTVGRLVDVFSEAWGGRPPCEVDPDPPAENTLLLLDPSKALLELGWSCRLGWESAVARTAREYLQLYRSGSPRQMMEQSIGSYAALWKDT